MRPFSLLIKPTGPDCNIACKYCFYSGKTYLFGDDSHRMNDEVLSKMTHDYLALKLPASSFVWQGGEPTLMGLDFYRKAIELQKQYGNDGQIISNALQTNAILLDKDWCKFLNEYKFLVGISLDGPQKYHDFYRVGKFGLGRSIRPNMAVCRMSEYGRTSIFASSMALRRCTRWARLEKILMEIGYPSIAVLVSKPPVMIFSGLIG
jgi:sulfatase maturation enzyme AslB (radical SAM superfamily)